MATTPCSPFLWLPSDAFAPEMVFPQWRSYPKEEKRVGMSKVRSLSASYLDMAGFGLSKKGDGCFKRKYALCMDRRSEAVEEAYPIPRGEISLIRTSSSKGEDSRRRSVSPKLPKMERRRKLWVFVRIAYWYIFGKIAQPTSTKTELVRVTNITPCS